MVEKRASLQVAIDSRGARKGQREFNRSVESMKRVGGRAMMALKGAILGVETAIIAGAVVAMKKLMTTTKKLMISSVNTADTFETLSIQMNTLYGSTVKGEQALNELWKTAKRIPFTIDSIAKSATSMKAWGALTEDIQEDMIGVADAAAATGTSIEVMGEIIGRAFSRGKLRLRGPGAKLRGMMDTKNMIEDMNEVSLPEFRKQLSLLLTDPKYGIAGASEKLAGTWTGIKSMVSDSMTILKKSIADAGLYEEIKRFGESVRDFLRADDLIKQFERLGRIGADAVGQWRDKFLELQKTGQITEWVDQWVDIAGQWRDVLIEIKDEIPKMVDNLGNMIESFSRLLKFADNVIGFFNDLSVAVKESIKDVSRLSKEIKNLFTPKIQTQDQGYGYGYGPLPDRGDDDGDFLFQGGSSGASGGYQGSIRTTRHSEAMQELQAQTAIQEQKVKDAMKALKDLGSVAGGTMDKVKGALSSAKDVFAKSGQAIKKFAQGGEKVKEKFVSVEDVISRISDDMTDIVMQTKSWNEGVSDVMNNLSRMFIQKGMEAGMQGMFASAKGNVFTSPSVTTIGERGPEAVVPLQRDRQGTLGLSTGKSEGGGVTINIKALDSNDVVTALTKDPQVIRGLKTVMGGRA